MMNPYYTDGEGVRCPHCDGMVLIGWSSVNRRTTYHHCRHCEGELLVKASVILHDVLPVVKRKLA